MARDYNERVAPEQSAKIQAPDHVETQVLLVSRPLTAERADGTVQLVRTLAKAGGYTTPEVRYRVLLPRGAAPPGPGIEGRTTGLSHHGGGWQALTFAHLLATPRAFVRHYFFTPTPRVVQLLRRVHRLRPAPSVQTFCSAPPPEADLGALVFADHVVSLSRDTAERLQRAGVPSGRIHTIPPAVPPPPPDPARRARVRARLGLPPDARLLVYLGDWDTVGTAQQVAAALPRLLTAPDRHAVLACRPKGRHFARVARDVRRDLAQGGAPAARIHLLGHVSFARDLAAAADLALFPAARLPDKMDLPLALLESLAAGVPALVASSGPLADLVREGAAVGVPAGDAEALAHAAEALLTHRDRYADQREAALRWSRGPGTPERLARDHAQLYRRLQHPRS